MNVSTQQKVGGLKAWSERWTRQLRQREDQVFLILTLLIGALVGLVVVAFILLTERLGERLYPVGGAAWRRILHCTHAKAASPWARC